MNYSGSTVRSYEVMTVRDAVWSHPFIRNPFIVGTFIQGYGHQRINVCNKKKVKLELIQQLF